MTKATYPTNLPPKAAIEYFQKKKNAPSWNWYDTWQDAHVRAFVVAKVTKLDILKDIRDMVEKSIKDGTTFHQFKKELQPKLEKAGWWGKPIIQGKEVQLGSPERLKTIYQTNLKVAYSVGRYKAMIDNKENRPYWQYRTREDPKVREEHKLLDRKVFHCDDPFWDNFYPPNGWRCRCYVVALKESDLQKEGLTPEVSKGNITSKNVLLSKKSGIEKPVAVYRDPATGKKTIITPGWSYNPGEAVWKPDIEKYPNELRIWFNDKDGSYILRDEEKKKIDNHVEHIRSTFKEWNNWNLKAKINYTPTDEEFYDIAKEPQSRGIAGFYNHQDDEIYIKTNTTLDALGLASKPNQTWGLLTFTHEFIHSLRNYTLKEIRFDNSEKEKNRIDSIEEGLTEALTRLWGVKYGNLKPEDLIIRSHQKKVTDLILYTIKKVKERGVNKGKVREEAIKGLCKLRTLKAEEVKEWCKDINPIEINEYRDFLPLAEDCGIIIKDKTVGSMTRGVLSWLLTEEN